MAKRRAVKGGYRGGEGEPPKRPTSAGASVNPPRNARKAAGLRPAARRSAAKSA